MPEALPDPDYLARTRALAPRIAAAADTIERRREVPPEIAEALIAAGLYRLLLPRSLGGAELLPAAYVPIIEEIAKTDASTAWCLNQNNGCAMTAAFLDPATAREIFGPPDGILAWGPGPGEARGAPGGYRVTATWSFASGSHNATWLGAHVPIVEADGAARRDPDGSPAVRTVLFPKAAARMTDIWHVIGLKGTGSDRYSVENLFVPERFCVQRDAAVRREDGLLYRFSNLQLYSSGFAGVALGIARASLDAFIALARAKVPFRTARTLRDDNVVQAETAQAEARLRTARAYLYQSLETITEAVAARGHLTLDERMTIRLASTFAIHQALAVVDACYHAAGSSAIFADNPFERRFRDIHAVSQQLQGRRQHFETVGQHLLGLSGDTSWL